VPRSGWIAGQRTVGEQLAGSIFDTHAETNRRRVSISSGRRLFILCSGLRAVGSAGDADCESKD
jgi:hypothetical protein